MQEVTTAFVAKAASTDGVNSKCGMEVDTDYSGKDLSTVHGVTSAELCRTICQVNSKCGAWTWGKARGSPGLTDVCFLKRLEHTVNPEKKTKHGVVSGRPCQVGWDDQPGTTTMFCWALMQPHGYEKKLLAMQYKVHASLFACDGYTIFSNQVLTIAGDVETSIVKTNITAVIGGEFMTALNTEIFAAVWQKVLEEGRFHYYSWTAKVDPDTVFLPERLRSILVHYPERPNGVYVNNCKFGLHGPIEVFSRNAVRAWGAGSERCFKELNEGCHGFCAWGEDLFIDQCLWKVLSVRREDNMNILQEDHCDPPKGWRSCKNSKKAGFHPFKTVKDWKNCWLNATMEDSDGSKVGVMEV